GETIFQISASFQTAQEGIEHQDAMPSAPEPENLPDIAGMKAIDDEGFKMFREWDLRRVPRDEVPAFPGRVARQQVWFRRREPLPDDPVLHICALAYMSDLTLLGTAWSIHPDEQDLLQVASLDHALWFLRPFRADEWLLYDQSSPSAGAGAGTVSGLCSSSSSSWNTRSAEAVPDCTTAAMPPSWDSGWLNICAYWMNACTLPRRIDPLATISPPSTAMPTYVRLPTNDMPGQMIPERNCAENDAWYSSSFSARNRCWNSARRPNTLTSAWPENDSSTRAFSRPTLRHWMPNAFCERGPMIPKITPINGRDTRATSASFQLIENIMTSTPITVSTEVSAPDSDCCMVCVMLSMSLVTREISSPRCTRSKYASGSRLIFSSTCSRSRHIARTITTLMTKPWPQVSSAPARYSASTVSSSRPSRSKSTPAPGTRWSIAATIAANRS
ncbi:MAG: thioesterase family protein, partial [Cellulomonas sp.]|nr:thioesterase family protein [Cellulomonas sp.]